jgi:hypothetical protein
MSIGVIVTIIYRLNRLMTEPNESSTYIGCIFFHQEPMGCRHVNWEKT